MRIFRRRQRNSVKSGKSFENSGIVENQVIVKNWDKLRKIICYPEKFINILVKSVDFRDNRKKLRKIGRWVEGNRQNRGKQAKSRKIGRQRGGSY